MHAARAPLPAAAATELQHRRREKNVRGALTDVTMAEPTFVCGISICPPEPESTDVGNERTGRNVGQWLAGHAVHDGARSPEGAQVQAKQLRTVADVREANAAADLCVFPSVLVLAGTQQGTACGWLCRLCFVSCPPPALHPACSVCPLTTSSTFVIRVCVAGEARATSHEPRAITERIPRGAKCQISQISSTDWLQDGRCAHRGRLEGCCVGGCSCSYRGSMHICEVCTCIGMVWCGVVWRCLGTVTTTWFSGGRPVRVARVPRPGTVRRA